MVTSRVRELQTRQLPTAAPVWCRSIIVLEVCADRFWPGCETLWAFALWSNRWTALLWQMPALSTRSTAVCTASPCRRCCLLLGGEQVRELLHLCSVPSPGAQLHAAPAFQRCCKRQSPAAGLCCCVIPLMQYNDRLLGVFFVVVFCISILHWLEELKSFHLSSSSPNVIFPGLFLIWIRHPMRLPVGLCEQLNGRSGRAGNKGWVRGGTATEGSPSAEADVDLRL